MAKIKIDFFDFFGVGGAGWQCHSVFYFFIELYPFGKKKLFLYCKFRDFLTIWKKAPFWLVENQKKMEI